MSKIIEGNLPLIVENQNTEKIKNYQIYGTADGAGVETENLFNINAKDANNGYEYRKYLNSSGNSTSFGPMDVSEFIEVKPSTTYTLKYGGTYSAPSFCIYDSQKNFVRGETYSNRTRITFTTSENEKYIRMSYYTGSGTRFLIEGSTAPTTYIPYGYKLPITVKSEEETENNFPFAEAGTFEFGNGTVVSDGAGGFTVITSANSSVTNSELIPLTKQYTIPLSKERGGEYIFYIGNPNIRTGLSIVFYDSNGNKIENWLCNSVWRTAPNYLNMAGSTIAYIGFNINANISVAETVITPMFSKNDNLTSYIPYRYSTTTPIYIGDAKLMAEEYVDYEEQKIYKKSKNYLKTHEDGNEIIHGITWTTNSKDGTVTANGTADSNSESLYGIIFNCPEDVPPGNYYYSGCPAGGTQNSVYNVYDWDANHSRHLPNWNGTVTSVNCYNNSEVPIKIDSGLKIVITCRVYRGITVNNLVFRPMLRAADSGAGFEPYFNLTGPPVALPELSLYKGTNTLSSTTELGKVILDYSAPEIFKVQINNQLYDLIDKNFYNIIANSYSSSLTYNEGDYCIYNYQLYKCISAISIPEDFDSEKWSQVTLAESLRGD